MRRHAVATLLLCCCLGVVACGSRRAEPPKLNITAPPSAAVPYADPSGDVVFAYPKGWGLQARRPPGVATISTGGASATFWAYPSIALVVDSASAQQALQRFLVSLKQRDPGFAVTSSAVTTVFQHPAFEVRGTTEIQGRPTAVRSVHAFNGAGEYVLDMLADPDKFEQIDRAVFQPLLVSWQFLGKPPAAEESAATSSSPTAPPIP